MNKETLKEANKLMDGIEQIESDLEQLDRISLTRNLDLAHPELVIEFDKFRQTCKSILNHKLSRLTDQLEEL